MRYIATVVMVLGLMWWPRSTAHADDADGSVWVPVGENWWCYTATLNDADGPFGTSGCRRTKQACTSDAEKARIRLSKAYKLDRDDFHCTSTKKVVGFHFHAVVPDLTTWTFFPTMKGCETTHAIAADPDRDRVSQCEIVSDVAPSVFDVELVPKRKLWYCAQIGNEDTCESAKDVCAKEVSDARASDLPATNCAAQTTAFALTTRGRLFAFKTLATCLENVQAFPEASSCKKL